MNEVTNTSLLETFLNVPPGTSEERTDSFMEFTPDSPFYPKIYDPDGEQFDLSGPVELISEFTRNGITKVHRTDKRRFVRVDFYEYTDVHLSKKLVAQAYAWQGDNGLVHLLERPGLLSADPLAASEYIPDDNQATPDEMDDTHREYLKNTYGPKETFEATT